jgi:hypothetical protein
MKIIIFDWFFKTTFFIWLMIYGLINKGYKVFVSGLNYSNSIDKVIYFKLGRNQNKISFATTSFSWGLNYRLSLQWIKLLLKKCHPHPCYCD